MASNAFFRGVISSVLFASTALSTVPNPPDVEPGGGNLLDLFTYDVDFVAGTAKGGTQPYGNNTNDGRFFRDPNNVMITYVPDATGLLISQTAAGLRRTTKGHVQYPTLSSRALWNRDLTNVAWTKTNVTALKDQAGANGAANSASSIVATANGATVMQSLTYAVNNLILQVDIKRLVGTGTLEMTVDNGATWTVISNITASYQLKWITQNAVTNPIFGFRIGTSGDAFAVDFVQLFSPVNVGTNIPTQYRVPTTTATQTPGQSRPEALAADNSPFLTTARGAFAFYWQGRSERPSGGGIITGATGIFCTTLSDGGVSFAAVGATAQTAAGAFVPGLNNVNKVAGYLTAGGVIKVACNGVLGSATGASLEAALDHFDLGTNGAGGRSVYGFQERFAMSPNLTFTDAELIAMTS